MARRIVTVSLAAVAVLALPASAHAQKPADVSRVEAAVVELAAAKRSVAGEIASRERAAQAGLNRCKTSGPGWTRIRKVKDASQRNAYRRGARALWKSLGAVALEGARLGAYEPAFERFLRRFEAPLADPVLQAGIDAQRKRLEYSRAAFSFGDCATFETLLKKVREFKIGGRHGVAGDYQAGRIHNVFVGYVADRQRAAARQHWRASYEVALESARDRLKELGGDEGYANYFAFAFRG